MRKTLTPAPLPPLPPAHHHHPARQLNLFATTKICVQVICNRFYSGACDCSSLSGKSSLLCLERKKKRKREGDEEKGEERCCTPPTHQCPSATTAHPIPPPEPNLACMDVPTCDNRDMGLYPKHSKPSPWRGDAVSKLEKSLLDLSHARISPVLSFHAPPKHVPPYFSPAAHALGILLSAVFMAVDGSVLPLLS